MRQLIQVLLGCFIFATLTGCNGPYRGKNVVGAEEFVKDSYKIREGKFSILDLEGKPTSELPESYLDEYKDVIHEDDILQIAVYHPSKDSLPRAVQHIGATIGYKVKDGKITLPDLGTVTVSGLTLQEAAQRIQDDYLGNIQDVEVFITYRERLSKRVELAGLVNVPTIAIDGKLRLWDVLAKARIPTEANLYASYVVRENQLVPVDLPRLMFEGDMSQNIVMRGGDKVYIADPNASQLLVMGAVNREIAVPLKKGYLSLRSALAAAGGIPYTGDRRFIQVIRGNIVNPKIYTLSWQHIVALPNDSLLCMPGDIVYVATTPIADWNRFISQLLPTFAGVEAIRKGIDAAGIQVALPP
jgi:polysaccharide biosynthesis/export protein